MFVFTRKTKHILVIATLFVSLITMADESQLFPLHGQEKFILDGYQYTPFWAQEYVGVDLAKSELRNISWAENVPVALFDAGFVKKHINLLSPDLPIGYPTSDISPESISSYASHGTAVANIINGKGPYGASEMVDYIYLGVAAWNEGYHDAMVDFIYNNKIPKIISNSMTWGDRVKESAKIIERKGTIWVTSSGNFHLQKGPISAYKNNAPVILVGSMRPDGLQSEFSQESTNLTIIAPSNMEIASIGINGEHIQFEGTSGAAPLVSGSLANAASLLPDLNYQESIILLKKTAIPTANQILRFDVNPAGLLNSYKLFKVAQKIALACGYNDDKTSQTRRVECKRNLLEDDQTYSNLLPDQKIQNILKEAASTFPSCFPNNNPTLTTSSDGNKIEVFNNLRKIAFLGPTNHSYWKYLACIAGKNGYSGNADFFNSISFFNNKNLQGKTNLKQMLLSRCYPDLPNRRELFSQFSANEWNHILPTMLDNNANHRCIEGAMSVITQWDEWFSEPIFTRDTISF